MLLLGAPNRTGAHKAPAPVRFKSFESKPKWVCLERKKICFLCDLFLTVQLSSVNWFFLHINHFPTATSQKRAILHYLQRLVLFLFHDSHRFFGIDSMAIGSRASTKRPKIITLTQWHYNFDARTSSDFVCKFFYKFNKLSIRNVLNNICYRDARLQNKLHKKVSQHLLSFLSRRIVHKKCALLSSSI